MKVPSMAALARTQPEPSTGKDGNPCVRKYHKATSCPFRTCDCGAGRSCLLCIVCTPTCHASCPQNNQVGNDDTTRTKNTLGAKRPTDTPQPGIGGPGLHRRSKMGRRY